MVSSFLHGKPDKDGKRRIFLCYSHRGKRLRISLGEHTGAKNLTKVLPVDFSKGRVKRSHANHIILNQMIQDLKQILEQIAFDLVAMGIPPTTENVKLTLTKGSVIPSFWDTLEEFREIKQKTTRYDGSFKALSDNLEEFESGDNPLEFSNLNKDWFHRFLSYLLNKGYQASTIKNKITVLKIFLTFCDEKGLYDSAQIKFWKFRTKKQVQPPNFFTAQDLREVEKLELENRRVRIFWKNRKWDINLNRVRDILIFYCYTGLRFGDGQSLTIDNLYHDRIVYKEQKGDKQNQEKPLPHKAKEIFKRLGNSLKLDSSLSDNSNAPYYRIGIKEIAKRIGKTQKYNYKGETVELWETFSAHSTRRSFVSIMLENGTDIELVRKMVGHADIQMVQRYDRRNFSDRMDAINSAFDE